MSDNYHQRFALNTYSWILGGSGVDVVRRLADRGWRVFELMAHPGHLWPGEASVAELRAVVEQYDLEVTTLNTPSLDLNLAAYDPAMRKHTVDTMTGLFELAGELGIPGVIVGLGKTNPLFPAPRAQLRDFCYAGLEQLIGVASRVNSRVYLENMPVSFLPTAQDLLDTVAHFPEANMSIVYDVANAAFIQEDVCEGLRAVSAHLALVHLSDTTDKIYKHDPIGDGDINFASIATVFDDINVKSLPVLEIITSDPDRHIPASCNILINEGW